MYQGVSHCQGLRDNARLRRAPDTPHLRFEDEHVFRGWRGGFLLAVTGLVHVWHQMGSRPVTSWAAKDVLGSLWEAWPRLGFGLKRTDEGGLHDRCPPGKRWVHCREGVTCFGFVPGWRSGCRGSVHGLVHTDKWNALPNPSRFPSLSLLYVSNSL